MTNTITIDHRGDIQFRGADLFFWSIALLMLFFTLGVQGLWTSEGRWAEIVREMLHTGDFFHPQINGKTYFDKPLLTYWLITLTTCFTGYLNEWAVRVPSALSALLSLFCVRYLGRRLFTEEVGKLAGWILLTTFSFLFWGRTGTADMENVAAIMLAVCWYWYRKDAILSNRGFRSFQSVFLFYFICFVGCQMKGLTALVVPILALLPDVIREKKLRVLLAPSHMAALVIALSLYLIPFLYAMLSSSGYAENGLAMVFRENIMRFFEPFDHIEPFYIYFYFLPRLLLPWSPLFLIGLIWSFLSYRQLSVEGRWCLEVFVLIFLFFTLSGSRRSYYILPAIPFCALLIAVFWKMLSAERLKRVGLTLQASLLVLLAALQILSPVVFSYLRNEIGLIIPNYLTESTLLIGFLCMGVWVLHRYSRFQQWTEKWIVSAGRHSYVLLISVLLIGGFFSIERQFLEAYRTEKRFSLNLKQMLGEIASQNIAFYLKISSNFLFYLDTPEPIKWLSSKKDLEHFIRSGSGQRVLIFMEQYKKEIIPYVSENKEIKPLLAEKIFSWEQITKKKNKLVALKIERKKDVQE